MSKEERQALEDEFAALMVPKPIMTLEELKHVESRGGEILRLLIDDDILNKLFELGKQNKDE
jgi:hypothetical protein